MHPWNKSKIILKRNMLKAKSTWTDDYSWIISSRHSSSWPVLLDGSVWVNVTSPRTPDRLYSELFWTQENWNQTLNKNSLHFIFSTHPLSNSGFPWEPKYYLSLNRSRFIFSAQLNEMKQIIFRYAYVSGKTIWWAQLR